MHLNTMNLMRGFRDNFVSEVGKAYEACSLEAVVRWLGFNFLYKNGIQV